MKNNMAAAPEQPSTDKNKASTTQLLKASAAASDHHHMEERLDHLENQIKHLQDGKVSKDDLELQMFDILERIKALEDRKIPDAVSAAPEAPAGDKDDGANLVDNALFTELQNQVKGLDT